MRAAVGWTSTRSYGLLLVDLGARRPIDVLPDDESATLASWLREHPGAKFVAHDRGLRSRDGVRLGAPNAIQVADRFYLLRNVVDALDQLQRQRRAAGSAALGHGVRAPPVAAVDPPPLPDPTPESKPGEPWRSYRAGPDQWKRARALRAQGWSIHAIGREISVSPKTVRRLLNRASPPSQEYVRHRHVPRLVEPFLPYLLQRWADGCRNGRQLTREIEQLGYLGKGSAVRWMIARWRPPKTPGQPKASVATGITSIAIDGRGQIVDAYVSPARDIVAELFRAGDRFDWDDAGSGHHGQD